MLSFANLIKYSSALWEIILQDAYREAKVNGFGVTVIRKGEVKLNIDKTLEEVEEEITEVGSKVYQDKIIQESSADISGLMKGVFGFSGKPPTPTKRRLVASLLRSLFCLLGSLFHLLLSCQFVVTYLSCGRGVDVILNGGLLSHLFCIAGGQDKKS